MQVTYHMIKLVSIIQAYIVREANSFDKSTIKKEKAKGMNLQSMIYSKHILLKPLDVYSFLPSFLSRHTTFNSSRILGTQLPRFSHLPSLFSSEIAYASL